MNNVVEYAPGIAITLVALGLLGYLLILALAAFAPSRPDSTGARLRTWLISAPAQNIGIPCAAIAAFAIVAALLRIFPPLSGAGEPLLIKVFSLEFSGPSGPITLWLMCFLGFILAIKLLRH